MIIKNYRILSSSRKKNQVLQILEEGLRAAKPEKSITKFVKKNKKLFDKKSSRSSGSVKVYLIAFGKAADSMSKAINSICKIEGGIVVIPKGSKSVIKNRTFKILKSGHPTPTQQSVKAAKEVVKFLQKRNKDDRIIFLISGGGSSLLSAPDGISLNEKIKTTDLLIKSGATINEINCIRKHFSKIKGGKLVSNIHCHAISLVISDVVGDNLSSISSGCTYFDNTTFDDAKKIIRKYNLEKQLPKRVIARIRLGSLKKIPETPKKTRIKNFIVLSNRDALDAMAKKAKKLGFKVRIFGSISGDVNKNAKKLSKSISAKKSCIIFGGEPTVHVTGNGKGGRNQELVLRILDATRNKIQNFVVASIGTDGIDGNTKYAGAISENLKPSHKIADHYLLNNDSNSFFKKYGGLIMTGHTHSNLMDIGLILN